MGWQPGRLGLTVAVVAACGGPALQNVPAPNPAVVAGLAAAVAGAATLADPRGAARRQERRDDDPHDDGVEVRESVPSGVLDRLDDKAPADAGPRATPATRDAAPASPAARDAAPDAAPASPTATPRLWPPPATAR